ncbi:MAG: Ig-like domain-containing protein [Verrucomicrobiae bacterium]|nr:Ig-like domain-containing protein [Verrucomicrobiae bacterium]
MKLTFKSWLVAAASLACLSTSLAQSPVPQPTDHRAEAAFRQLQLQDEKGNVPADGIAKAMQQKQAMAVDARVLTGGEVSTPTGPQPKVADLARTNWVELGPGNIGGRLRAILTHPTDPNTLYIGSIKGGIWKTSNGGASWSPLNDYMANLAVATLVMDPTTPNIIYAGTGEGYENGGALQGAGIFKTTDAGVTWQQLSATTNSAFYYVNRLAICPTNHLILIAATGTSDGNPGGGIWRSTNGGTNWIQTCTNAPMTDVAFNPADGNKCIASGSPIFTPSSALYSTNAGLTWMQAAGIGMGPDGRIEIAYAPSSPNIVYASEDTNNGSLFVSTDGGASYTLRNSGTYLTGTNYLGSQGWYANCIWVDPTNPNTLIVGGLDLYRSTDGGSTLTQISQWDLSPASAHADHHAIVSAANYNGTSQTTVYFGNDGGIYAATNALTVTPTSGWSFLVHNLGVTEFWGGAGNPTSGTVVGGAQDNGTVTYTTATGSQGWVASFGGDGGFCAADQTDPNYFYGEYTYLQIHRSTTGGAINSSVYINGGLGDAGLANPDPTDPDAPGESSANFIAPFILDPNNPNTMLAGGSNLWRSVNVKTPLAANVAWSNIKAGITNGDFISAIAVAPGNSDIIWVGHNGGEIFATANGTAANPTWTQKNLGTPHLPGRYCNSLTIDSTNANIVYATFGGFKTNNVYRTTDGGITWSNLGGSLPAIPVRTLAIAPFNHNYLYIGTEIGIFGSADGGVTWSPNNEGPANVTTAQLFWMRNNLTAATGGRGIWQIPLGPPTAVISPGTATGYAGLNFTFNASAIGTPTLNYQWQYDGNNIAGATGPTFTVTNAQPTNAGLYRVIVNNTEGTVTSAVSSLTVVVSPPYRTQALATGPLAYWRFNETADLTAYDLAGTNNGTIGSTVVLGTTGPVAPAFPGFEAGNTAFQFNGTDARVSVPPLNLNSSNLTITAWVKRSGAQSYAGIVSWNSGGPTIIDLGFGNSDGRLTYIRNNSVYNSPSLIVPDGQWTFVALALTSSNAVLYMATNSALTSYTITRADATATVFTNTAYIGYAPYGSAYFNGGIDEVAIFNQLLSPAQLTNLMSSAATALPAVTLTTPVDGSSLPGSPNILLTASVTTNSHTIGAVRFYDGPALLNQTTTPPYQFTWSGAMAGLHTLLAQVTYDGSSIISSSPANITVTNGGVTVNTNPTNIVASVSGTNLTLFWPADHTGWRLLAQTNNLANGVSRNTNDWGTVAGSAGTNQVFIPVIRTNKTGFYRLIYP